jgi:hypothetical protein
MLPPCLARAPRAAGCEIRIWQIHKNGQVKTYSLNLEPMQKISDEETADKDTTQKESSERSLGVLGLTALLFFNVGGGPFGTEGLQQAGGPFFSVIGLLILSLVWSLPVGLMTAELGTAFPRDGGYVLWVEAAFGEFWAFQVHSYSSYLWIKLLI